jgi:hypothetical protein
MQGGRKLSAWNLFVKKIYAEGKKSSGDYSFKQALTDASKRKGEMGNQVMGTKHNKKHSRKNRTKRGKFGKKGSRRHH